MKANDLLSDDFSFNKLPEAQDLYSGGTSFFRSVEYNSELTPDSAEEGDNAACCESTRW